MSVRRGPFFGWADGLTVLAVAVLLGLGACRPEDRQEAYPRPEHGEAPEAGHGTMLSAAADDDHDEADSDHEVTDGAEAGHDDEDHGGEGMRSGGPAVDAILRSVKVSEVVDMAGPDGQPFMVALRTPEVGHYPCTSCHVRPIGTKEVALAQMHSPRPEHEGATRVDCAGCHDPTRPGGLLLDCTECHEREGVRELMPSRSAHLTVRLSHPTGNYRNCFTCHAPENPGTLALRDGTTVTLDEAYRLCAGCHFMQANDWAGGAHGKRLAGWRGERVILSCTGCHNPHDPAFPVRRPVTFPKIARQEGGR